MRSWIYLFFAFAVEVGLFCSAQSQAGGPYGTCSASCGTGYQTRTSSCGTGCTTYDDKQCSAANDCSCSCPPANTCTDRSQQCFFYTKNLCNSVPLLQTICPKLCNKCPENTGCSCGAKWSIWSAWKACSITCGSGTQVRYRNCNKITGCGTQYKQSKSCLLANCPGWSNWGNWQSCSATSGSGTRTRTRTCSNGQGCSGSSSETESCLHKATSGGSPYGTCSASCGTGYQTRTSSCGTGCTTYDDKQCSAANDCSCSCPPAKACTDQFVCPFWPTSYCYIYTVYSQCPKKCNKCPENTGCNCDTKWSTWSAWKACSVTCGSGTQVRYRNCNKVTGCGTQYKQSKSCLLANCLGWSKWTQWTKCDCSTKEQRRTRTCSSSNLCSGDSLQKRSCVPSSCQEWRDWENWQACSTTCGQGTRKRIRTCRNGPGCVGPSQEFENCGAGSCPYWKEWDNWTTCTKTCGKGKKTRERECQNGPGCSGSSIQTIDCNAQACPSGSPYGRCSASCGVGYQTRTSSCGTGCTAYEDKQCSAANDCSCSCPPAKACTDQSVCPFWPTSYCTIYSVYSNCPKKCNKCPENTGCNCDAKWSTWSAWKACSVTCGSGTQVRYRNCNKITGCGTQYKQSRTCPQVNCPGWSKWTQWTKCDCSTKEQRRTRTCSSSNLCSGDSLQKRSCVPSSCPEWLDWENWQACSTTCGQGTRKRIRTCRNGPGCVGPSQEFEDCGAGSCPYWKEWDNWTTCTKTCGKGKKTRERECQNGPGCSGSSIQTIDCNTQACPSWSVWRPWQGCSPQCGPGKDRRERTCNNGPGCPGKNFEEKDCNNGPCPDTWSDFGQWSSCSKTCGPGTESRTRTCDGTNCAGVAETTRQCNLKNCEVSGSTYSACSRSCGLGTQSSYNPNTRATTYKDCTNEECTKENCENDWQLSKRFGTRSNFCCNKTVSNVQGNCGVSAIDGRIVNGQNSKLQQWPWMVLSLGDALCGGALISKKWVVTAAHCVENWTASKVILGALKRSDRAGSGPHVQEISVKRVVKPSGYVFPYLDIALLELERDALFGAYVRPICLPRGEVLPDDTMCVIAGWGVGKHGSSTLATHLQEAEIRTLPMGLCRNAYLAETQTANQREKLICAGKVAGGVDSCQGDSGGPLICQRCSSCSWFLAGITSFGIGCADKNRPGMYTNVQAVEAWIRSETGIATESALPSCT